jgi:uncharacterized protein YndB with AHSA1/START domain
MNRQMVETRPVLKSVTVDGPIEHAFRVFTEGIGTWWPLDRHSVGEKRSETVTFESGTGGRIVERIEGGEESVWGEILAWEPPRRLVFTWHPGEHAAGTEVEVRFIEEGAGTRVELEHRGWERVRADAAETRAQYDSGWPGVLECYVEAVTGTGARSGT